MTSILNAPRTLHVCDLDGTLLRPDATLSAFAVRGLQALLAHGVLITVASARSVQAMHRLLRGLEFGIPVVELNGAYITELSTGRHLQAEYVNAARALEATTMLSDHGADPVVTTWDGAYDHVSHRASQNSGSAWFVAEKYAYRDQRLRSSEDLTSIVSDERVATIVGYAPVADAQRIATLADQALGDQVAVELTENLYVPGWSEIHIASSKATKGAAVATLRSWSALVGVKVAVYGDARNDLSMFEVADYRIAPANADPSVLAEATTIVGANTEDGIVRHLLDIHGLEISD